MKYKICHLISLSIIVALLVLPAIPAHAAAPIIFPYLREGKISDRIQINVYGFNANKMVDIYFSSDAAGIGDTIGGRVKAYERMVEAVYTGANGSFSPAPSFYVPSELTGGEDKEEVHGGDYYFYATYFPEKTIVCVAEFTVIDGEIKLTPREGAVGSEIEINGEGLRPNQKISVEYGRDEADITGGDGQTDGNGEFICTIIIPESVYGSHTITVFDETGNRPEAEFNVRPKITLDPAEQAIGKEVMVNGTGFSRGDVINITMDGTKLRTTPLSISTDYYGSFNATFILPFHYVSKTISIEAWDDLRADAQLTVLLGIALAPVTTQTSPGYIGMELSVGGAGFTANAPVTITYTSNGEAIPVATATADADGNLSASFTVPPSVAGSHTVTASDGSHIATSTFIMDTKVPPVPILLSPGVGAKVGAEVHLDWGDVIDPSGVSYTLQLASDAGFTSIILERKGLLNSEYKVSGDELASAKGQVYWRVQAVDGASNEGEWTPSGSFYLSSFWSGWVLYALCGLGVLLLIILIFWLRRRSRRPPTLAPQQSTPYPPS